MSATTAPRRDPPARRDRSHYLYLGVLGAVVAGVIVGFAAPGVAVELKPLGTGFVNLIKMMISPVIFCTIVLGIGSIRDAAKVGKVGGLALAYFLLMSTVALVIGLVVGNLLHPGAGLHLAASGGQVPAAEHGSTVDFLLGIIPTTLVSPLAGESVLQTLFVALLVGFAVQALGDSGKAVLRGVKHFERVVFRVLSMIMWLAPIGAFGAIAAVVGSTGVDALKGLGQIMVAFYLTCFLFIVVVLGLILRLTTGIGIVSLLRYLAREYLLIVSTSSSEAALPRLVAKMEHLGISRPVVGITVPTGYSFNLDGTAIYLTMASLFVASALGRPLSLGHRQAGRRARPRAGQGRPQRPGALRRGDHARRHRTAAAGRAPGAAGAAQAGPGPGPAHHRLTPQVDPAGVLRAAGRIDVAAARRVDRLAGRGPLGPGGDGGRRARSGGCWRTGRKACRRRWPWTTTTPGRPATWPWSRRPGPPCRSR
jgi:aerobic C4-dicarboxylate transport protein